MGSDKMSPGGEERHPEHGLSPEVIDLLADLSLASEKAVGLAAALREAMRQMAVAAARHPSANIPRIGKLQIRATSLQEHMEVLGGEVMRFSHLQEDFLAALQEVAAKPDEGSEHV